jgi:tRNA-dihydrouridine synthase A
MLDQTLPNKLQALKQAINIPLSIKSRIGVDNQDSYDFFTKFACSMLSQDKGGLNEIIVHARKAILGLAPKKNWQVN